MVIVLFLSRSIVLWEGWAGPACHYRHSASLCPKLLRCVRAPTSKPCRRLAMLWGLLMETLLGGPWSRDIFRVM